MSVQKIKYNCVIENDYIIKNYPSYNLKELYSFNDYDFLTIKELIDRKIIDMRVSPSTVKFNEYDTEGSIPFLRTSDLDSFQYHNSTTHKVSIGSYNKFKNKQNLKVGDILLVKDGNFKIGDSILIDESNINILVQSHFYIITPLKIDPYVFYLLINQTFFKNQILSYTTQSTLSTIGSLINNILVPIPTSKEKILLIRKKSYYFIELKNKLKLAQKEFNRYIGEYE